MLSLQRTLSPRYLLRRWTMTWLVVLSIGVGVAALVATRTLSLNLGQAAKTALNPLSGICDLMVTGDFGVERGLVQELRDAHVPGVKSIHPLILSSATIPELNNRSVLVVGAELPKPDEGQDPADNHLGLELKELPRGPLQLPLNTWAGLGSGLAADLDKKAFEFTVRTKGKTKRLSGVATVNAHGPAAALGGSVIYLRLDDAAKLIERPDRVSRIDLVIEPGQSVEDVRRRVAALVGSRAEVQTPAASEMPYNDAVAGVELSFNIGGACALVVGLFLVYNALSVSVAERRHDIGILRSLGATRGQITGLFTGEALVLGLVGSAVGLPLGWLLAFLAQGLLQGVLSETVMELNANRLPPLTSDTILLALAAGTATALLASLVPALQAAREEPAEAVRRAPTALTWFARGVHAAVSLLIIGVGAALVPLRDYLPHRVSSFGAPVLMLLGLLVATPLLAALLARLLQPVARLLLDVPERLAADNLARSPGRTGLVIAALAAGVALVFQTAGVMRSSQDTILTWLDRSLAADLVVTANSPITSSGKSLPMAESVGAELEKLPEVRRVVPFRYHVVTFRDRMVSLLAVDGVRFYDPDALVEQLPGLDRFPRLRESRTVIVSDNFAALYHVREGDTISLQGPHGPLSFRVIGTVPDYQWNRGTVFIDRDQYAADFDDHQVDVYELYLTRGSDPEAVIDTINRKWGASESLIALTRSKVRDGFRDEIARLYAIGYAQELVVGMVAALGVVMALLISVLQRRRELGLLRAVGASQYQLLRSVLAEATLMGVIGATLGLLFGLPMEWYAVRVLLLEEAGFDLPLTVPWTEAALVAGLAVLIATVAGLWPALESLRLRIADAIAYE
jgi:putative ABC transport system permease protein